MASRISKRVLSTVLGLFSTPVLLATQAPSPLYDADSDKFAEEPMQAEHAFETFIKEQQARLDDKGVHISVNYWGDFFANPVGGKSQSAAWTQLLLVGAEIDFEKTIGWHGASLVSSIIDVTGSNISGEIGNLFAVPQAYLLNTFGLYDLYLHQEFFDGAIVFDVGRMNPGQFFATLPAMTMVVSAAVNGNPTSLFVNGLSDSISSPTWGAHMKIEPSEHHYVEAGIFQASGRNSITAYRGADFSMRAGDGVSLLAEMGWTPDFKVGKAAPDDGKAKKDDRVHLPGIYTFGAYLSVYAYDQFQGGASPTAYGFYWLAQQMVWRSARNPLHNVSLWGGITYSPQEQVALLPVMGMGGVILQGFVPGRDADNLQVSFYTGGFSQAYGDAQVSAGMARSTTETVIEASYIIQVTPSLQIQPDIQYVFRPSGTGSIPDALVLGGQVSLSF